MKVLRFGKSVVKNFFGFNGAEVVAKLTQEVGVTNVSRGLNKRYRIYMPRSIKYFIALYDYFATIKSSSIVLDVDSKAKRELIIHFCCWGQAYYDKVSDCLIPSLFSDGNLPSLSETLNVELIIHVDQEAKNKLLESRLVDKLQEYVTVNLMVIPVSLLSALDKASKYPNISIFKRLNQTNAGLKYFLLGRLQMATLEYALQKKAYVSFLMPDFILSNYFFANLLSKFNGKTVAIGSAFRTSYPAAKRPLSHLYKKTSSGWPVLSLDVEQMVRLQLQCMHKSATYRVISKKTIHFRPCAQLLFKTAQGYIMRSFHYQPILIDCAKIRTPIKINYRPLDDAMLSQLIKTDAPYDEQVLLCDNARFMELSDDHIDECVPPFNGEDYQSEVDFLNVIEQMITGNTDAFRAPLNRYFSSLRYRFEGVSNHQECKEEFDDVRFMNDLTARLEKCSDAREWVH
ncbi:MAG: hypothetical protein COB66_01515 [Coxiella sp. (in: Bacteria)]|nr:MAG: hypothetical protein COB66_01515 [Coxiella sp. (in: g-proteobacteria)]